MKLFRKRSKLNNKGLSLVELVCAVAIFAVATTVIGGAMVVSAQNYSRGTNELDLQQEAQTATNLIGDLLYDATGASFNTTSKTLEIEGPDFVYRIVHEGTNLKYEQYVPDPGGSITLSASGILAENVLEFNSPDLAAHDDFDTDKNVEIELKIGDATRSYKAEYSTTARNGKADSSGVTESAEIIVDRELVLEPGQLYTLPFEVVGTITNKSVQITPATGLSIHPGANSVSIQPDATASGAITIRIETIERKKDNLGNPTSDPAAFADVDVKIRRVNKITSPMDDAEASGAGDGYVDADSNYWRNPTGSGNYKAGTEYRIEFDVASHTDYANKVFGKKFDMDYVNPRQVDISYTMNGGNVNDYVENVVINNVDNPYITFNLKQDMPNGSEIVLTATAKHPNGTNKTGFDYDGGASAANVVKVVKIKCDDPLFTASNFVRGSDGVKISITQDQFDDIIALMETTYNDTNMKNQYGALMTIYEWDGSTKTKVLGPYTFGNNKDDIKIDAIDSARMAPHKAYIVEMVLMFYHADGSQVWEWDASPYRSEITLDAVSVDYKDQTVGSSTYKGTVDSRYQLSVNSEAKISMEVAGVNMQNNQNALTFDFEKKVNGVWVTVDPTNNKPVTDYIKTSQLDGGSTIKNSGEINYRFEFKEKGTYRAIPRLTNFSWSNYTDNGSNSTGNGTDAKYSLYSKGDGAGNGEYGICYFEVN